MSLVKRINLLCEEHDTTFAEVERKCELSNGSIRRWDTNTPSTDKLEKVANHFNVSADYLLGRTPFSNKDEALTSISIASVKYIMYNRIDFDPHFADGSMDYYFDLLYESNYRLYKYIDRLITMYLNKDNRISNLECFELANILFKDIKYDNKNYDGLIYLMDFYGEGGIVKLNLSEIPKFTKDSINFDKSLLYKIRDTKEDNYITHTSLLTAITINNQEEVEIDKLKQSFSHEALEVAKAYDSATADKKTIIKLTLGLSNIYNDNSYLLPDAAHEIEGASDEDKAHDDSILDDEDF